MELSTMMVILPDTAGGDLVKEAAKEGQNVKSSRNDAERGRKESMAAPWSSLS